MTVLQAGCVFDLYMDIAFCNTLTKYQSLVANINELGYKCRLVILIFGRLGHVPKLTVTGLRLAGLPKKRARQLAKLCNVFCNLKCQRVYIISGNI